MYNFKQCYQILILTRIAETRFCLVNGDEKYKYIILEEENECRRTSRGTATVVRIEESRKFIKGRKEKNKKNQRLEMQLPYKTLRDILQGIPS